MEFIKAKLIATQPNEKLYTRLDPIMLTDAQKLATTCLFYSTRTTTLKDKMRKAFYYLFYQEEMIYLRQADRTADSKYNVRFRDF